MRAYDGLTAYYGDLPNHYRIPYGHGSLEDAFLNALELARLGLVRRLTLEMLSGG